MKKALAILAAVLLPVLTWGQAQINTKKVKIGDFTQKITKIVLTGNDFIDTAFKDEVTARWRVSPYEFCTLDEFNSLKGSDEYYFLMITKGQFKKDLSPTIQFMTLIKGGQGADKGIDGMLEIVSLPIAAAQFPSGREIAYIPAFLDIIQDYTLDSMEKDANAYGGLTNYTANIVRSEDLRIAKGFLAFYNIVCYFCIAVKKTEVGIHTVNVFNFLFGKPVKFSFNPFHREEPYS